MIRVICFSLQTTSLYGSYNFNTIPMICFSLLYIGYFHHMYYKDFVHRYQVIAPEALERLRSRAHEMTEVILMQALAPPTAPSIYC